MSLPSLRTVTVVGARPVVIADEGTSRTSALTPVVMLTEAVWPEPEVRGASVRVTVTPYSTTLLLTVDARSIAVTCPPRSR